MTPGVQSSEFGRMPDGTSVRLFTLRNANGLIARIINYGATITELHTPDRAGHVGDIVLGFDNLPQYLENPHYIGSTIGRVANRIAGGRFTLDAEAFTLARNNGANHLHGGVQGFDKVVWEAEPLPGLIGVRLTHESVDGAEGYPGRLEVAVVMTLTDRNELAIDYTATTDRPTPVNLTNHSYFNLAGQGDVLGHELMLFAEQYLLTDETLVPTGGLSFVTDSALDFSQLTPIAARLDRLSAHPGGYDHTFAIKAAGKGRVVAARVFEPETGRAMEVATTEPSVHLYTANYFDGTLKGKRGVQYPRHAGLSLEAQRFPDAVNQPSFPGTILRPGETYRQTTVYRFGAA